MPAHVAGLFIVVRPECLDAVARRIGESLGARVHAWEHQTGRLVVTLDTPGLREQEAGFKAIANLPGVCSVDLVCHFVDADDAAPPHVGAPRLPEARP